MKHGFFSLAAACPSLRLGDCAANADSHIRLILQAEAAGVHVLAFPKLSLTGATVGELLMLDGMLDEAERALAKILSATASAAVLAFVGLPLRAGNRIRVGYAAIRSGRILAAFTEESAVGEITLCGQSVPADAPLLRCAAYPALTLGVEMDEGHRSPLSPAARLSARGATVIVNPAACPHRAGESAVPSVLAASHRLTAAYIRAEAGAGESTGDGVYGGHCLICADGVLLSERAPFGEEELITAAVDCRALLRERARENFPAVPPQDVLLFDLPERETAILFVDPHPIYPADAAARKNFCRDVITVQSRGLSRRLESARAPGMVVGLSGGLDSCLAILAAAHAADLLGRPRSTVTAISMPCYGTTDRTRGNAQILAEELGATFREIPIGEAVALHFRDIGHDPETRNVVYENAQARERTQILMDVANAGGDLVVGTGDLSELALGWATYNGDHMSSYGVNAGVPKTLVRQVVAYCAAQAEEQGRSTLAAVLRDILATPVSPELLPAADGGEIAQRTEDLVGPYELHDFFLWHLMRLGESREKILRLANIAFAGEFAPEVIERWLGVFWRRFRTQQFKRSCLPDGPRVIGISLSPRSGWHMPSDMEDM